MKPIFIFYLFLLLLLVGCGKTRIITNASYTPNLYVNDQFVGKGSATITRTGPPKRITITAKYNGEQVGSMIVKRKFTGATCLIGYFSYGIGLVTAWRFPETILLPLFALEYNEENNPWTNPANSIWMVPQSK